MKKEKERERKEGWEGGTEEGKVGRQEGKKKKTPY